MNAMVSFYSLGATCAIALLAYLLYALLSAEEFQ